MIPPGATLGILGNGQLGRMLATAAARLGHRCHVYGPDQGPAADVAAATVASYEDIDALDRFAEAVDVVTFEFENVPVAALERLGLRVPVRPGPAALALTQDRVAEKRLARSLGIATADFAEVAEASGLAGALERVGTPAVLKTRRMGYDGHGQAAIRTPQDAASAWVQVGGAPSILEAFVPFAREVSVVCARSVDGALALYDVSENAHRDHILKLSRVPARIAAATAEAAVAATGRIADALAYVGVLAVEWFVMPDGALVFNEVAPRVHNSGHWTPEACVTGQFEQHVRAVLGMPLGSTRRLHDASMENLIGSDVDAWPAILAEDGAIPTRYGKHAVRPRRKMGHVTRIAPLGTGSPLPPGWPPGG